jgi:RNA polymerase sigma factor (sigma-70 family)
MRKENQMPAPKFGPSDYEDLALIAKIKYNDQMASQRLFKKYAPVLTRKFYTNFKNQEELKDTIMEIMEKVFENLHRYEMRYTFNSWITALASNYVTDFFRGKKRRVSDLNSFSVDAVYKTPSGDDMQFDIPCEEPEVMTAKPEIERQAKLEYVYDIIDKLPEFALRGFPNETIDMFVLYKYQGESVQQIAKKTGLSSSVVKTQLNQVNRRFEQAELERRIMDMYLKENMTYENMAKKLRMDLRLLKVTIWRTKDKIASQINIRKAVIDISTKYALEQLRGDGFVLQDAQV